MKNWPMDYATELSLVDGDVHLVQPNPQGEDAAVIMSPTRAREVAQAILKLLETTPDA